jgi:hypothetical protein
VKVDYQTLSGDWIAGSWVSTGQTDLDTFDQILTVTLTPFQAMSVKVHFDGEASGRFDLNVEKYQL